MRLQHLLCFLLALPLFAVAQTQKEGLKTLDQPTYSIQYPAAWTLDQTGLMGTKFILFMPSTSDNPAFSPNLNLIQQEMPQENVDIAATIDATIGQLEAMVGDFTLLSNNKFNTPSGTCHELQYTGRFGDNPMQFLKAAVNAKRALVPPMSAMSAHFAWLSLSICRTTTYSNQTFLTERQ
jgi:hypothetical protein